MPYVITLSLFPKKCLELMLLTVLVSACSLVGHYQPRAHAQLTELMVAHLQLIDDVTAPSGDWHADALSEADSRLRLRFAEALAYAESLHDPLRTDNLHLLQSLYRGDRARLFKQHHPFTAQQAALWRKQTQLAYLEAIRGECSRPASPCQ